MSVYNKGDHIFIPFKDGCSLLDRQGYSRTYKSKDNFITCYDKQDDIELVEYAPITEAVWINITTPYQAAYGDTRIYLCGSCGAVYCSSELFPSARYCRSCGARMKGVTFNAMR